LTQLVKIFGVHEKKGGENVSPFFASVTCPKAVRTDNGPEFTSKAFMTWGQTHDIRHILTQPGRPMQNVYIESFNGEFHDEHLNESWFETLHLTRTSVAIRRTDYNQVRPQSSLRRIPPARFAS
jgi:putative transposase